MKPEHESVRRTFARFTTPPRCTASPRELRVLARAEDLSFEPSWERLDPKSSRVAAYAWGTGPTVMLVHGWGGRAAQLASFVDPLVERGLRVVTFDAAAHGSSPGARTSVYEFVAALTALARDCGPLRAAVGHSLGGAAIAMCAVRGLVAPRVVLLAPTARLSDELRKFTLEAGLHDEEIARVQEHMRAELESDIWQQTRLVGIAPRLAARTLVVHDEHDADVPFTASVELVRSLPDGALHATRGLGHLAILRTPEVVERVCDHVAAPA